MSWESAVLSLVVPLPRRIDEINGVGVSVSSVNIHKYGIHVHVYWKQIITCTAESLVPPVFQNPPHEVTCHPRVRNVS